MFHIFARFILFLLFKIFFRLKVFGRENFPKEGSVIVAPNHASFLDPMIVGVGAPRKLNYLARDTLFRFKPFARMLHLVNTSPIKRESGDINAFKLILNKLSQGKPVLIFPEGTRSRNGVLQGPKSGIGFLQVSSRATVLPCYVKGSIDAWPRHSRFPRVRPVSVYFGRPLRFGEKFSGDKRERYIYIAEQVMVAIGELEKSAN